MAQIIIKPTIVFKEGTMFIFGSWVCVVDGVGIFHRQIAPAPEEKHYNINLHRQALEDFVEKFNKIFNLLRGPRDESEYNSSSPTSRTGSHELAVKPSCESVYNKSRFLFGLRNPG